MRIRTRAGMALAAVALPLAAVWAVGAVADSSSTSTTVTWTHGGETYTADDFPPGDNPSTNPASADPGWPGWSGAHYHRHPTPPAPDSTGPCGQPWGNTYIDPWGRPAVVMSAGDTADGPGTSGCETFTKDQWDARQKQAQQ